MTSTPQSATSRRTFFGARAIIIAIAATICCVLLGVIGARLPLRIDATATRDHRLSDRTLQTLDSLRGDYELVVAVNGAAIDPASARRTRDVLDAFERTGDRLRVTMIDVSSPTGLAQLDSLLKRLVDRYQPDLRIVNDLVRELTGPSIERKRLVLGSLSDALEASPGDLDPAAPNTPQLRKFCIDAAAVCRLVAQDLHAASKSSVASAATPIAQTPVPAFDEAIQTLRAALLNAQIQLKGVADASDALVNATPGAIPEPLRDRSRRFAPLARTLAEEASRDLAALDELPRLPLTAVARVLERSSAAIVIGPPRSPPGASEAPASRGGGVTAIDVDSLFPAALALPPGMPTPDLRARTEDLVASAITSLSRTDAPIVVLVHATDSRLAPSFSLFKGLVERLHLRSIDLVEWPVAIEPDRPILAKLNPDGARPVVYVTLPASVENAESAQRMLKLAAACKSLLADAKPVLFSVNPSSLPGIGQPDPLTDFFKEFGIVADTGRPLLMQQHGPQTAGASSARTVAADLVFVDPSTDHPVAKAIRGLPTDLLWSLPLTLTQAAGLRVEPIVHIEGSGGTVWAESQWSEFRRIPAAQRSLIANPPAPDSQHDDGRGPWIIAASAERAQDDDTLPSQRIIVVSSNGWFFDEIAQASAQVDGRSILQLPGNVELFEACVAWLAHQDDRIAASPQAGAVALIPAMSSAKLATIRWGLIAGLPLGVLVLGAAWRLIRG